MNKTLKKSNLSLKTFLETYLKLDFKTLRKRGAFEKRVFVRVMI